MSLFGFDKIFDSFESLEEMMKKNYRDLFRKGGGLDQTTVYFTTDSKLLHNTIKTTNGFVIEISVAGCPRSRISLSLTDSNIVNFKIKSVPTNIKGYYYAELLSAMASEYICSYNISPEYRLSSSEYRDGLVILRFNKIQPPSYGKETPINLE